MHGYFEAKGLLQLQVSTFTTTMRRALKETCGTRVVRITRAALRSCCCRLESSQPLDSCTPIFHETQHNSHPLPGAVHKNSKVNFMTMVLTREPARLKRGKSLYCLSRALQQKLLNERIHCVKPLPAEKTDAAIPWPGCTSGASGAVLLGVGWPSCGEH